MNIFDDNRIYLKIRLSKDDPSMTEFRVGALFPQGADIALSFCLANSVIDRWPSKSRAARSLINIVDSLGEALAATGDVFESYSEVK